MLRKNRKKCAQKRVKRIVIEFRSTLFDILLYIDELMVRLYSMFRVGGFA